MNMELTILGHEDGNGENLGVLGNYLKINICQIQDFMLDLPFKLLGCLIWDSMVDGGLSISLRSTVGPQWFDQ